MKSIVRVATAARPSAGTTLLAALLAYASLAGHSGEADLVRVQFRAADTLFANPGQGWMSQQRSPQSKPRFPCAVANGRFNWADAEPEPGHENWKLLDNVLMTRKPRGAAVAMRLMPCRL